MEIRTPAKRWQYLLFVNLLWFSIIPTAVLYYSRLLQEGAFPTDADSIGIPIMGTAIAVLAAAPFLNVLLWITSRRYPGSVSVFGATGSRGTSYWIWTVLAIFGAGISIFISAESVFHGGWEWAVAALPWLYVCAAARVIVIRASHPNSIPVA